MVPQISVKEFKDLLEGDSILLDTRTPQEFTSGFIPGSIFLDPNEDFQKRASLFLPLEKPILLVAEDGKEEEIAHQLKDAGIKNLQAVLKAGFTAWTKAKEPVDLIIDIDPDELAMDFRFDKNMTIIDLRAFDQYKAGHVRDAINLPLAEMADVAQIAGLDEDGNVYFYGNTDAESVTAASLLKLHGMHHLRIVNGGWESIQRMNSIPLAKVKETSDNKLD